MDLAVQHLKHPLKWEEDLDSMILLLKELKKFLNNFLKMRDLVVVWEEILVDLIMIFLMMDFLETIKRNKINIIMVEEL